MRCKVLHTSFGCSQLCGSHRHAQFLVLSIPLNFIYLITIVSAQTTPSRNTARTPTPFLQSPRTASLLTPLSAGLSPGSLQLCGDLGKVPDSLCPHSTWHLRLAGTVSATCLLTLFAWGSALSQLQLVSLGGYRPDLSRSLTCKIPLHYTPKPIVKTCAVFCNFYRWCLGLEVQG